MRDLRVQYFLTYCVIGAVLPFVSVYFRQAGLTNEQVSYAWSLWSLAVVLSPVVVTLAADAHVDPRLLLVLASGITGGSLVALGFVRGLWPVVGVWALYCLASQPVLPLQDGVHFSTQRRRRERGEAETPYHLVRVWGTIGFIIPSVVLFVMLQLGMSLVAALWTGAACAGLAALQAVLLPDPRPKNRTQADAEADAQRRLPTLDAARVLMRRDLLVFTAAVVLLQMAASANSSYYPIYLTERVGLGTKWIGPATILAVFIEMFFVFGAAALVRRLGVKKLMLLATLATALRFALISSSGHVAVAFGTQIFHGLLLVAVGVLPQILLDEHAGDRFRHSMQGLFVMVTGGGRFAANWIAGPIAQHQGVGRLYAWAAVLCVAAAGLILLAYRQPAATAEPPARQGAAPAGSMTEPSAGAA